MRGLRGFFASRSFAVIALFGAMVCGPVPASAQQRNYLGTVFIADPTTLTNQLKVNADGSINVDASATIAGFTPSGNYSTPISVSNSSSNVALPSGSPNAIAVYNVGTVGAYCKLGTSNAVTATTADDYIPGNSAVGLTVGSNTYLACITASSTTTVNISGGSGILTGFGGGGSSGGSNAAASATGSGVPADAGYTGLNNGGNLIGWIGDASGRGIIAGAGTAGSAAGGVLTVQGIASMTPILANPGTIATWGLAPIGGTTGSPTNAMAAGCQYNSSAPTFSSGDVGGVQCTAAGSLHTTVDNTNANGQATMANSSPVAIASNQSAIPVSPQAVASGGASNYGPLYSAASNNATNVKSSAGTLYTVTVTQSTTTAMELKLYNTSSSPTCSSATGIIDNIPIPSNATSPGYHLTYPVGRAFSTGISFCLVAFGNPASSTDNSNAVTGATVSMTYD